jgi:hypothetical protein
MKQKLIEVFEKWNARIIEKRGVLTKELLEYEHTYGYGFMLMFISSIYDVVYAWYDVQLVVVSEAINLLGGDDE